MEVQLCGSETKEGNAETCPGGLPLPRHLVTGLIARADFTPPVSRRCFTALSANARFPRQHSRLGPAAAVINLQLVRGVPDRYPKYQR